MRRVLHATPGNSAMKCCVSGTCDQLFGYLWIWEKLRVNIYKDNHKIDSDRYVYVYIYIYCKSITFYYMFYLYNWPEKKNCRVFVFQKNT